MRLAFQAAAFAICGSLTAALPVVAAPKVTKPHFYYFSVSKWARGMKATGQARFVEHDGHQLNFTDKNRDGKRPTRDSVLVLAGFGRDPKEITVIVDREAFDTHRAQQGVRKKPGVVVDATARKASGVMRGIVTAQARPAMPKQIRPGGKRFG